MLQLTGWLNKLVKTNLLFFPVIFSLIAQAQEPRLPLAEAYRLSRRYYPQAKQQELIRQTENLGIRNIGTAFLPQLSFNGQATYQSDVTQVNIPLPGIKVPSQSKDQYRAIAEVSQQVYDGGVARVQKSLQHLNASIEDSKIAVELYQLHVRITQVYFNILYQDELLKQAHLALADIATGINKISPQVENGTMLRSSLQVLQVQQLQIRQRITDITSTKKGLADALSLLIHQPVDESTVFEAPDTASTATASVTRPELVLYRNQSLMPGLQQQLVQARNLPKAGFFVQGGYGKPGLNLLSDRFDWFYIGGIRLNWSLGNLYTRNREKQLAGISRQSVEVQQETFLLNTSSQLAQQQAEIARFTELVASDTAIVSLRAKISAAAKAQLENAVITASDFIREVNAEDQARQLLAMHRLQLLQAAIQYQLISGKLK